MKTRQLAISGLKDVKSMIFAAGYKLNDKQIPMKSLLKI